MIPVLKVNFNFLYGLGHLLGFFVLDEGVFKLLVILDTELLYPSKVIGPEEVDTVHLLLDGRPFDILGRHTNL